MAKFQFKMQSLLSAKEKIEEMKKLEFRKTMEVYRKEEHYQQNLIKNKKTCIHIQQELLNKKKIDFVQMRNIHLYNIQIKKKIEESSVRLQAAQQEMEEKRKNMLESMQQRKMLERLKEKALLDFITEENRQEQINIDELISYRYKITQ